MTGFMFWLKHTFYEIIYCIIHSILAFYYRGKKQTVPPTKNPLLLKSASRIADEIRNGKIKSEEVVQAYIERIWEVEPYINAVVQDRFQEALEEAREVDKIIQEISHSQTFSRQNLAEEKPFFGVPFTIKLLIKVKGLTCSAGSKLFKYQISDEDAPCVALIKKAGGIILANTNTPEFGFSLECFNLLYGKTCNPYDTTRIPGASSGGEAALLGAGASVVGLGNDMIGSVRLPAHFTGIFSHKPSMGLVNSTGSFPAPPPDYQSCVYVGPMCRYSEDLAAVMKILSDESPVSMRFGKKVDFRNLKIYFSTSILDPKMPSVDHEIVSSLLKAVLHFTNTYNVTAKRVKIPFIDKTTDIILGIIIPHITNIVKFITLGKVDSINPLFESLKSLFGKSQFSFSALIWMIAHKVVYRFLSKSSVRRKNESQLEELKKEIDDLLDENSVFIYPTHPVVAPYHYEMSSSLPFSFAFTATFNFTGHPVTHCPLGLNKKGLPYGLQIVGAINNDPLTIACAEELGSVFGGWIPPK